MNQQVLLRILIGTLALISLFYAVRSTVLYIRATHADYTYNIAEIIDNKSFFANYDFYPNAYNYGIALRRASPYFSTMQKIISEDFAQLYPNNNFANARAVPLLTTP